MKKRCLLGNCELDERQLMMRGNVFQHMAVLLMMLLLLNGFMKDYGVSWAPGMWENMLILWAGIFLGLTEYILRDITPAGSRQGLLYIGHGLCGAVLLVLDLGHILGEGSPLAANGALTEDGAHLIFALEMLGIFLVYLGKRLFDRFQGAAEE